MGVWVERGRIEVRFDVGRGGELRGDLVAAGDSSTRAGAPPRGGLAAPRRRLHRDAPTVGADREAALGRYPHAPATGSSSARSLPVNPAAAVRGRKHVVTKGATPVLSLGGGEEAPGVDRLGHPGRAPGAGAALGDALQLPAGERGPGDAAAGLLRGRGWLKLHEKGGKRHDVPAHHGAAAALDAYVEGGRARGAEGGALPERRPGGAPADGDGRCSAGSSWR